MVSIGLNVLIVLNFFTARVLRFFNFLELFLSASLLCVLLALTLSRGSVLFLVGSLVATRRINEFLKHLSVGENLFRTFFGAKVETTFQINVKRWLRCEIKFVAIEARGIQVNFDESYQNICAVIIELDYFPLFL